MAHLIWNAAGPAPYESSWSIFVKLLAWNCLNVPTLYPLIARRNKARALPARERWAGDWIDFERFAALLAVDAARLRRGFISELGVPAPDRTWRGIRHCPQCLDVGFHSSLFDIPLLKACPWHGDGLTEPCLECFYLIKARRGTLLQPCPHARQLLSRYAVRAPRPPLADALTERVADLGAQFVAWWAAAGRADPDRDALITDFRYAPAGNLSWDAVYKFSFLVERVGAAPMALAIPTIPCDALQWRSLVTQRGPSLNRNPEFTASYKSLRRHLGKRFIGRHRACLRRLRRWRAPYDRVYLNSCVCRVAVFFAAWRDARECIFPPADLAWPEPLTAPRLTAWGLEPFAEEPRAALHYLYADFVRALQAVCALDSDQSFLLARLHPPHKRLRLLGFWCGQPQFSHLACGDPCTQVAMTLVYPKVATVLADVQDLPCRRQPAFAPAEQLPYAVRGTYRGEQVLAAVQVAADLEPDAPWARIYL